MKQIFGVLTLLLVTITFSGCGQKNTGPREPEKQFMTMQEKALLDSAGEIQQFVAEYRGLNFLEPVAKRVQTKQQTENFLIKRIDEEFSREEISGAERLLKRLALLPDDYDYYSSMVELMTEQLAGMYDYKERFLAIAEWLPLEMQQPILAHELAHALQDQHYGLENYLSPETDNDDRALALSSLVEGDATLVGFAYTMRPMGREVTAVPDYVEFLEQQSAFMEATLPLFASSPRYIKQTLMFSYAYGTEFVKDFLLENGWDGIEEAYNNPPVTSEQIMHPEKYLYKPDLPQDAEHEAEKYFKSTVPYGKLICTNVLGEFTTYLMLREFLDEETARKGAEGWDGDLVTLTESLPGSGKETLRMTFCWDNEEEAREFLLAYEEYLVNRYAADHPEHADRTNLLSRVKNENRTSIIREKSTTFIETIFLN